MIPATQSISEPTTVGRSQLCLDIKISKAVALRTHPATADLLPLPKGDRARIASLPARDPIIRSESDTVVRGLRD
jgi:hypothetical protein